jgi:gliding motility-associated lipoprotein GldH
MKPKIILLFLVFFTTLSCSEKSYFRQFDELSEDNHWELSDKKTYVFEISDTTKNYNLTFLFSHVYDYQFNTIPIHFEIENPDGTLEKIATDLVIKDANGKQVADCTGDICDLKYIFKENTKLQKGSYKVTISHNFNGPYLPNVIGIGLKVTANE